LTSKSNDYDETILLDNVDGFEYVKSIRNKNIFVIFDFRDYELRRLSQLIDEWRNKNVDTTRKEKEEKKLKLLMSQIPSDEPPLLH